MAEDRNAFNDEGMGRAADDDLAGKANEEFEDTEDLEEEEDEEEAEDVDMEEK